jgi:hypothetical protein
MSAPSAPLLAHIAAYVDEPTTGVASLNAIILAMYGGKTSLSAVVATPTMAAFLTSVDEPPRRRATLLLAEVVNRVPALPLQPTDVSTLAAFFMGRLADAASVREALFGLVSLTKHHALPPPTTTSTGGDTAMTPSASGSLAVDIVSALFAAVVVQQHSQSVRKFAYELLWRCATDAAHGPAVNALGADFARGVVTAMDEERDPVRANTRSTHASKQTAFNSHNYPNTQSTQAASLVLFSAACKHGAKPILLNFAEPLSSCQ